MVQMYSGLEAVDLLHHKPCSGNALKPFPQMLQGSKCKCMTVALGHHTGEGKVVEGAFQGGLGEDKSGDQAELGREGEDLSGSSTSQHPIPFFSAEHAPVAPVLCQLNS